MAESLVGRSAELRLIGSFLDGAATAGGALLLLGEPGVGKTALLDAAAAAASAAGTRVIRAQGVEPEADMDFSGLHQALDPLAAEFNGLTDLHRDALSVVLGFGAGPPPDRLVVANAALTLLRQVSAARPHLLIVDDVPWLDRPSADVLGFVARRLAGSPIGLLAAARSGVESRLGRGGLPEHEVAPLTAEAASDLMRARAPMLAPEVCRRMLAEAQGNPLALLELPTTLSSGQQAAKQALPPVLPLSRRLQALFESPLADLPGPTRQLLLLAALDGTGELSVLQAATGDRGLLGLAPAERSRLVGVDASTRRLAFRHPLTRSAIVGLATSEERRGAHRMLAEALAGEPERRARQLAEAAVEPDEQVAGLLEQVAHRIVRRGDGAGAVAALTRAAELSPSGSERGRRLAEAAFVGANTNWDIGKVPDLLVAARSADPERGGSLHAAAAAAVLLINGAGDIDAAHRVLVGAIAAHGGEYDAADEGLMAAIATLSLACSFGGRADLWAPFHAVLSRLKPDVPTDLRLLSMSCDPVRTAAPLLDLLDGTIGGLHGETELGRVGRVSSAACYLDRLAGCREPLWRIVRTERDGGAVTQAISSLMMLWMDEFVSGRWDDARQLTADGLALCERTGSIIYSWVCRYYQALLAAARGDRATVQASTAGMMGWALPRGAHVLHTSARHARALDALGRGDFDDAYRQASAISPAGVFASHVPTALWVCMDLVEAAVRTNRHAEAAAHVTAMHDADIAALSPRLALLVGGSAALAAPDHTTAVDLFEQVLASPGLERWPFDLARVRLAYGECLRRAHANAAARGHLGAALEVFHRLGAQPWATRAGNELRAGGRTVAVPADHTGAATTLTAQEQEIADLAATGLTNKQIGERLFLSHRTVGTHLYRIFPKLGITTRAALRDALAGLLASRLNGVAAAEVDRIAQ